MEIIFIFNVINCQETIKQALKISNKNETFPLLDIFGVSHAQRKYFFGNLSVLGKKYSQRKKGGL